MNLQLAGIAVIYGKVRNMQYEAIHLDYLAAIRKSPGNGFRGRDIRVLSE
jgi:hypothetical protein